MVEKYIYFGEKVEGYKIPVLNEREARAAAGILLLPAIVSFVNSYLTHDFIFTKIFVIVFMVDFFIRIFINPNYAPSLILGRFFVQNQTPEYVGAKQKRFAWSIGFVLSVIMFFIIVIFEIMTQAKIAICLLCITFLFSESAFGICLGCTLYHKTQKNSLLYCPGNVCEIKTKEKIQQFSKLQILSLILFVIGLLFLTQSIIEHDVYKEKNMGVKGMKCGEGKCGDK
ncbi:DUF4395 domain-containing protein [Sulfurovum sp.]|uniref:DUF4395 domain-containing protein n=1 Tax=Sulfurovum sp. TaxID=1969726 RepID=UPI0028681F3D|nr:DUF4395 domain-containing protein [Sulfurovum sp.]